MPLTYLNIPNNPVKDLSPLRGMPLERMFLTNTKVSDLSPLAGSPIKSLYLGKCEMLTDVAPLVGVPTLENLVVPPKVANVEVLRKMPKLRRLGYELTGLQPMLPNTTVEEFWTKYDAEAWLRNLQNSGLAIKTLKQLRDGTWEVNLDNTSMRDLTLLRGGRISMLSLNTTAVADLTPLRDLPLKKLNITNTAVTDLSPLQGRPLTQLVLRGTKVTDLSALRGMRLTALFLANCRELTDLSPLAECRELTAITLPPKAKDIAFLRNLPKLERISYREDRTDYTRPMQSAAEFWQEYDAKEARSAAP
jgi:Leucine-rich repeat (LRR) protein